MIKPLGVIMCTASDLHFEVTGEKFPCSVISLIRTLGFPKIMSPRPSFAYITASPLVRTSAMTATDVTESGQY